MILGSRPSQLEIGLAYCSGASLLHLSNSNRFLRICGLFAWVSCLPSRHTVSPWLISELIEYNLWKNGKWSKTVRCCAAALPTGTKKQGMCIFLSMRQVFASITRQWQIRVKQIEIVSNVLFPGDLAKWPWSLLSPDTFWSSIASIGRLFGRTTCGFTMPPPVRYKPPLPVRFKVGCTKCCR